MRVKKFQAVTATSSTESVTTAAAATVTATVAVRKNSYEVGSTKNALASPQRNCEVNSHTSTASTTTANNHSNVHGMGNRLPVREEDII